MKKPLAWLGQTQETLTLKNQNWYPAFTASRSTANELIQDFGFKKNRVFPFRQGLNKPCPKLKHLPQKFKEPTFIYVGRFSKYKGIDATLLAFKQFYEKFGIGNLYIVGKKMKPLKKIFGNLF